MKTVLLTLMIVLLSLHGKGDSIPDSSLAEESLTEQRSFDSTKWKDISHGIDYKDDKELVKDIEQRNFDQAKWKEISRDINYSDEKKPRVNDPAKKNDFSFDLNLDPSIAKGIVFAIVIFALLFLLYKIFGSNLFKRNPSINSPEVFSEEVIMENATTEVLENLLQVAINENRFRDAIRIYYLIIIRTLSTQNKILWKKDKTNREYLYELKVHPQYLSLKEVTRIFEIVWYRDMLISERDFRLVRPRFESLIQSLLTK